MNQAIYSPALTANQKSVYSTPITSVYQHIPANKTSVNADLREFSTFSTNQPELKGNNEPKTLNSLVSYCLSNQSRILVTLADIGQFLKLLTESALGSNFDSPSKLTSINTKTLNSQYSRQVQSANAKSKDKSIIEKCLQPIIANIENIQTEVANKLQEFDASNQTDHSSHINFTSKADSPMTSFPNHYLRLPGSKANDVSPKIATSKLDQPTTLNTVGKLVRSPSADQKPQKANETDCSNYDILNTEYSQSNIAALHNIPSSNPEQLSPTKNKNFDRLSQNTEGLMKSQNDALNSKKSEQQKNPNPVWTLAATGTNSTITGKSNPKQKMVPAIRLNFLTNPKPLSESKKDQNTQSCTKLRGEEQSLQTQEKGYLFNNTGSLRTVEDRDSRGAITARFGLSSDRNESSQVKFISAKNTAREQYNTPRDSARLLLNSLPKKELNDESVDNGERTLITEQVDAYSIPFIDEKIPFDPASFKNSARDSVLTRSDSPFEQFAANIAQKERAIIKTLMKDQYGEELVSSYHKGNFSCRLCKGLTLMILFTS